MASIVAELKPPQDGIVTSSAYGAALVAGTGERVRRAGRGLLTAGFHTLPPRDPVPATPGGRRPPACQNASVLVERLNDVDAFVVFDLEDAACSAGVVRSAPKILVDGATWLARSATYQFAVFEMRAGGASAGVNAPADERASAIAAFVRAVEPWVASRRFVPDAAKGVSPGDLEPLHASDPRPDSYWTDAVELAAAGLVAAAESGAGGLDGRTLAIEGFDAVGAAVARASAERGARVVAVGTAAGTARDDRGLDAAAIAEAWQGHGADLVGALEPEPAPVGAVLGVPADVLLVGSRAGIVDHGVAAGCAARTVVPSAPIPVTAKGLAVLRRAGVTVLPDFVTTAGPMLGGLAPALDGAAPAGPADVADRIRSVLGDVLDHEQGPLLGACQRAEGFLRTWRDELPFGRPLA